MTEPKSTTAPAKLISPLRRRVGADTRRWIDSMPTIMARLLQIAAVLSLLGYTRAAYTKGAAFAFSKEWRI